MRKLKLYPGQEAKTIEMSVKLPKRRVTAHTLHISHLHKPVPQPVLEVSQEGQACQEVEL